MSTTRIDNKERRPGDDDALGAGGAIAGSRSAGTAHSV
jgi:hypothetical protein